MNNTGILLVLIGTAILLLILPTRLIGTLLKIIILIGLILFGVFLITQGINILS